MGNNVALCDLTPSPLGANTVLVVSYIPRTARSWTLLEDLAIYDNESWNDPRDFAKPVKAISLPQDVPTTSDYHLIEFENQVQCLMEAHLAPKSSVQVNKIASSCDIYSGPHDTQYCIENPEQAFVDYTSSRESISEAWTRFKGLLQKVPHHAGSKLHDKNAEESWTLLEDLALYDNESWNDPRDFAKPVKAISLPQDVPSTFDCHLIELENQVQCLMEAHLAPKSSVQVNKIASSCDICSGPHDTQYCIENPEQAFVDYTSSRHQCSNDGSSPKRHSQELKLNANHTSSVSSAYPMEDPQCSSHIHNLINAINTCSKQANEFQKDLPEVKTLAVNEIGTPKSKELEQILEDEFKDLHLNLPVLEVLAHALMYNAILNKYMESLELGKSGSAFIQGKMPKKMKDSGLFTLPYRLGDSKPFDTLADLGSCVNLILAMSRYRFITGSNINRPELAFEKLVLPLSFVVEGLMANVQNEDFIYTYRIGYVITSELCYEDTSSFFNMESYGVMVTSWLP
ncbi:hypothetical protein Tco_0033821 [Tanacetum coccineum]